MTTDVEKNSLFLIIFFSKKIYKKDVKKVIRIETAIISIIGGIIVGIIGFLIGWHDLFIQRECNLSV